MLQVSSGGRSPDGYQGPSLYRLLDDQAEQTPDALAILAPGRAPLGYGRLRRHVVHVVQTLNTLGVGRHDRVALVLPPGPELAVAFLALAAGATCAPLNPAYRAHELDFYLADLKARVLLIQAGLDSPARAVARARGIPIVELSPLAAEEAGLFTLAGEAGAPAAVGGFAQPDDVALVLHTSGTTARPKRVPLTQRNLCASGDNIRAAVGLTSRDRCLNVMPLFHIHGLSTLFASLAAGASVVCPPAFDALCFFEWLEAFRPTWYTAAPTIHQAILERAPAHRDRLARCPLRFLRSASSAMPPKVLTELEGWFHAPFVEAYGMTEASPQIASNPLPPGRRKLGSVGLPAGPEVAIMDEAGRLLPAGETGEVVIRGANVTPGYENDPAANRSAFCHGWFRTGDQGHLDADGYLFLTGRLKELINRGGEKVAPREVEEVLLDHPAVAQAVTFAVPHARLGEDVAAAVVLRPNATATERELRAFAAARLADFKVPRQVVFVPALPQGATTKLQRRGLAEQLGLGTPVPGPPPELTAPGPAVEQVLAQIWAEVLNVERVGRDDDFFRSGGDSLSAAHLLVQIEQRLGRKLPMASLLEEATLASLARRLSQPDEAVVPALVELQPRGSQPPFFCVHGVGGEVLAFADLAQQMAPDQPFYAFQTRRVNGVQEPFRHVEPAAAHYLEELRAVQPEGPYYLGGFSFGGCVAFEMAQQLRAQGQQVALLAIIDQAAPPARFGRGVWGPAFAWEFLRNLPYWLKEDLLLSLCQGSDGCAGVLTRLRLKAQALKRRVSRLLGRPGSGSVRTDVEETFDVARLPEHFRKLIEAHYEALRGYVPQVYPGRVTLFRSRARPLFQVHGHDLGWGELAGGGLEVIVLPGNHESILKAPLVRTLAERLKVAIRTARAASQQANGPEGAHHLTPALTPRA